MEKTSDSRRHMSSTTPSQQQEHAVTSQQQQSAHQFHSLNKIAIDNDFDNSDSPAGWCGSDGNSGQPLSVRVLQASRREAYNSYVYLKISANDARERKCSFCLGFFSVLLVVIIAVVLLSTLDNVELIFLRLGESEEGEADLVLSAGGSVEGATSLNYGIIKVLFPDENNDPHSYHAPRIIFPSDFHLIRAANPWTHNTSHSYCYSPYLQSAPCNSTTSDINAGVWSSNEASACAHVDCLAYTVCNLTYPTNPLLVFLDLEREERMGYGRAFRPRFPRDADPDYTIIETSLAHELNVSVGDRFILFVDPSYPLHQVYQNAHLDNLAYDVTTATSRARYTSSNLAILSLYVGQIVSSDDYKLSADAADFVFMQYSAVNKLISTALNPSTATAEQKTEFAKVNPDITANTVTFNFPPNEREKWYKYRSYDNVRAVAFKFAGSIINTVGFDQINVKMPLVHYLYGERFFSLFMSLILGIIIAALSFLSIVLIYSLLTVNIESRIFELGVMRMVGYTKTNLTKLVIVNALLFAIPAWIVGLVLGQLIYTALREVIAAMLDARLPSTVSATAAGIGTLGGLGIPLIASTAPISTVLTHSLPEALNTERGRVKAIDYKIEREQDSYMSFTRFFMGLCLAVFSFLIYYLLPTGLLNFNLSLLFAIFFGVLLALLAGMTLLVLNFERFAEAVVMYVFFFWENKAVLNLVEKNLTTHRPRNRKTSLMFALTLAFVIFITVALNIEISSIGYGSRRAFGTYLRTNEPLDFNQLGILENILAKFKREGKVYSWAYDTKFYEQMPSISNSSVSTLGRFVNLQPFVRGVSPNFFNVLNDEFLEVRSRLDAGLSPSGYLYTRSGSASLIVSSNYQELMNVGVGDTFTLSLTRDYQSGAVTAGSSDTQRSAVAASALLDAAAVLTFSKYPNEKQTDAALSIPTMVQRSLNSIHSVEDISVKEVSISVPADKSIMAELESEVTDTFKMAGIGATIENIFTQNKDIDLASNILYFFFIFTQLMATVICFFALLSTMSTNVLYQAKEIGIMRCIGLKQFPTYRIYVWEAFVVVASASLMGLIVGTVAAYTMLLQQSLLTQLPLPFSFPWTQLVIVVIASVVCAFASSYGPVKSLLSTPSVTHILRRTT